jgi:signal transduction histidine kinase
VSARAHKILYVDDEPANLTAFSYCFGERFEVLTVQTGEEALAVLAREPVAVLLTDQRMPGMTGAELCARARERFPDVVRMVVTAYADIGAAMAAINSGQVSRYILKPWREEQMGELLRAGIEAYDLGVTLRELQVRMLQTQQQTTSTYLIGRVLHEIANPAGALSANIHYMADSFGSLAREAAQGGPALGDLLRDLQAVLQDAVTSIDDLVSRLDHFRRGEPPAPPSGASGDLTRAVQTAAAIVGGELTNRARLRLELGEVPPVAVQPMQLSQILVNLLMNAAEAIDPGRPEQNTVTVRTRAKSGRAVLEIEDTGSGIPKELLPRVFEPFVSTKNEDVTRGFGLAVVRDLVQRLRGDIHVTSEVGRGTCFVVDLPLVPL